MFTHAHTLCALTLLIGVTPAQICTPESSRLLPAGGMSGDRFGNAVALEGGTAVVAAHRDIHAGFDSGTAYVFERVGAGWRQAAVLAPANPINGADFGASLDIEDARIVVGATGGTGKAYVFDHDGVSWQETAELGSSDPGTYEFGWSVALSGDRLVAGAPGSNEAFVFARNSTGWSEEARLTGSGLPGFERFGIAVAIDDDQILVGATEVFNPTTSTIGRVFVYARIAGVWTETQVLAPSGPAFVDEYGTSIDLEGDTAVVGASEHMQSSSQKPGRVFVYRSTAGRWSEEAVLTEPTPGPGAGFGSAVALSGDRLAVAGWQQVHVFARSQTTWNHVTELVSCDAPLGGESAAFDGSTMLSGSPGDDPQGFLSGSAFVFELPGIPAIGCTARVNSQGCTPRIGFGGFASVTSSLAFDITATEILSHRNGLFFYGTQGGANVPFKGGTLCVAPPLRRTPVQGSGGRRAPGSCSGSFSFDFNAHLRSGSDPALLPGTHVNGQYWYRDSHSAGFTDAIEFEIQP